MPGRVATAASLCVALLLAALSAAAQEGGAGAEVRVTLVEAVGRALSDSREARIAGRDAAIAREGVSRAQGLRLPRVDASADYTAYSDPPAVLIQGQEVETSEEAVVHGRVTAEQTLYDFGRTSSLVSQAKARSEAASSRTGATRERLAIEAIGAFLRARRAEELRTVAEEALATARDYRRVAGDQYENGVVAFNDVLAADVQVANAEATLIAAENRLVLARSALALRIGLPGSAAAVPAEGDFPAPAGPPPALEESLDAAFRNRSEIRAQEAVVREGEADVTRARSAFAPSFFGQGAYAYDSNDFNPNHHLFSAVVGGRINLFSGFSDEAARREARSVVEQRRDGLALLRDGIALDVKAATFDAIEAEKRLAVAGTAVARAEENLRIQNDRYAEGLAISTEVLDAQTLLTRAKVDQRNARYDLAEARFRLLFNRGELISFLAPHMGASGGPAAPRPAEGGALSGADGPSRLGGAPGGATAVDDNAASPGGTGAPAKAE